MTHPKIHFPSVLVYVGLFAGLVNSTIIHAQTGNPIMDAPKFRAAIDSLKLRKDSAHAQVVLDFAKANSATTFDNYDQMIEHFKNDTAFKYIYSLLKDITVPGINPKNITASLDKLVSTRAEPQSSILGTPAIDALGTFIAERFKQEMEIAFLNKFKEWLEGTSKTSEALRTLLPQTKIVMSQNDPYQYTVFLETLKESFRKDLNNIPVNIGTYLGSDPFGLAAQTPYYFTSLLVYNNIVQVVNGQSIIGVLKSLDQDSLLPKSPATIQSVIYLTSLTSQLLNNPTRSEEWLDVTKIKENLNSPDNIKIFTELFLLKYKPQLEKIKTITGGADNLYTMFVSKKNSIYKILDWLKELATAYSAIQKNYTTIKDAIDNSKGIPGDAIINLENSVILTFKTFFKLKDLGITIDASIESLFDNIVIKVRSFTELVVNIKEKNYGLALASAIDMISNFVNNPSTINIIKKYGNFAVSIAKAENKNDMLAALETAALPVGSYRIKRNAYSNISLNAYAGISGGVQIFSSDVPAGVEKTNNIFGFTAPIGLAFSWGFRNKNDSLKGSSSTIFLSALDIGAVTAFRLTNDSTESLPELKWSNLLAPGAFYVYGFNKSPISCGLGVQYGPQLRSIKNNSAVILPPAFSIKLFVAVDIPIFNFHSRSEKKNNEANN
jgi:hypothetical protein